MKLPRVKKWRDVKRVFGEYGIVAVEGAAPGHGRPKHPYLASPDGQKHTIPASKNSDDIFREYIEAARRKFRLTPDNGVSDEEFYGKF